MPDPLTQAQRTERFDLKALYETSQLLSASLDLDFVLDNLLLTAMSKLFVTRGVVLMHDPVEQGFRVATVKGISKIKKGEIVPLGAMPSTMLQGDDVPELLSAHRIATLVPIVSGHRDIGMMGLGQKATRQPFATQELEFLHSLVNMSSAAVNNSLMVQELQEANHDLDHKVQQLNTLFDLSQEFNATIDRKRLIKTLSFALMGQLLVTKYLFLLRRDAADDANTPCHFEIVSTKGIRGIEVDDALANAFGTLKNMVLLQDEEIPEAWAGLHAHGLKLVLPIRHQDQTQAVLCLGPKMTGQPYRSDDMDFLFALGNLAFVSIQNTYLVEEQIEKERLEEEVRLARNIQEKLLPQTIPSMPTVEVATLARPSRDVGGDYFDVVQLDENRLLVAIADVTGKGVPASLLMANLQACLHTMVPMDLSLEEGCAHINRVICNNTTYDKFITFFHGIYDVRDRSFRYINAGHNPPMLVRADGQVELLEKGGLLLGVMQGLPYESGLTHLHRGDVLAMFTDGVTEAMSPDEEEYDEKRLEPLLVAHRHLTAHGLRDTVWEDIQRFTHHAPILSDDLTMIMMKGM